LRLALKSILEEAKFQLSADIAAIMLLNPHTLMLEFAANIGYRIPATARFSVRMGEGIAGKAALERRTIAVPDLAEAELSAPAKEMAAAEGTRSIYATPLIVKGQVIGVMTILFRTLFKTDQYWMDFFETLAGQVAIAIDSIRSFESLQRGNIDLMLAYDATIEGWSHAMDLRDKETEGHTLRVTELTERLARTMGMSEAEIVHVRRGALLHDMGKMGIPDTILLKPDKLTDEEWVIMRRHPQFAYDMLSPITYLRPALDIPYCHHEKWDGTGYPRQLKGEQIPLAARIFAVIDVYDALTSDRPYRKAWSREKTLEHIKTNSGTHFDPKVVEAFIRLQQESKTSN
jgi:putative nucleotidyltransferase with HDIG domain